MMGLKARAFGPLPPVTLEDLVPAARGKIVGRPRDGVRTGFRLRLGEGVGLDRHDVVEGKAPGAVGRRPLDGELADLSQRGVDGSGVAGEGEPDA